MFKKNLKVLKEAALTQQSGASSTMKKSTHSNTENGLKTFPSVSDFEELAHLET